MQMLSSWKPCSTCGCVSQHMESKHGANSLQNQSQQYIAAWFLQHSSVVTTSQLLQEYCTLLPYPVVLDVYILVSIRVIKYDFLHYLINPVTSTCTFSVVQSVFAWLTACMTSLLSVAGSVRSVRCEKTCGWTWRMERCSVGSGSLTGVAATATLWNITEGPATRWLSNWTPSHQTEQV